MPDLSDLDTRIRELVAVAVADAPEPPELGAPRLTAAPPEPDHRRWWIGGTAAMLAAAAAVVTFVLVGNGTETVTTPATVATTTIVEPTPTTIPTSAGPATTIPPTTMPMSPPFEVNQPDSVVTAGPGGLNVVSLTNGTECRWLDTPVDIGLAVGDGRLVVLPTGATTPELWTCDGPSTDLLATVDGQVVLHDVAIVGDGPVLLYSVRRGSTPDDSTEDLYALTLDDGSDPDELGQIGGWESGTRRLHLAPNGLIIGESSAEVSHRLFAAALPGSPAESTLSTITPAALGLEDIYGDCSDCPRLFTVDDAGRSIVWIDGGELVITRLDDTGSGDQQRIPLAIDTTLVADVDAFGDTMVVSYFQVPGEVARPAVLVPMVAGAAGTPLDGLTATHGPGVALDVDRRPLPSTVTSTVTPTTTTPTPAPAPAPAEATLVTAGHDGVAVFDDGVEVRRLDQPAEIALLTPGGAVIFQAARTTPDGHPGDPQIWRPDGTVAPFLGALPANQWYRLHDVAPIAGIPTVLYGLRTDGGPPEEYTEVVKALSLDPAGWRTADLVTLSTWEGGVSRLALSSRGDIVGTASESVTNGWFGAVVPGSPADDGDDPSVPPAGVESSYSECDECPDNFTISADGSVIAWIAAGQLVVRHLPTGEEATWTLPAMADPMVSSLDVRPLPGGGVEAAISFGWFIAATVDPPVVLIASTGGGVVESAAGGRAATFGP